MPFLAKCGHQSIEKKKVALVVDSLIMNVPFFCVTPLDLHLMRLIVSLPREPGYLSARIMSTISVKKERHYC